MKQEMMGWQWRQLGHLLIVTDASVGRAFRRACVCLLLCLSLCLHSNWKTAFKSYHDQSRETYGIWQDLDMHWPWGQKVKGQILTLSLTFAMGIGLDALASVVVVCCRL